MSQAMKRKETSYVYKAGEFWPVGAQTQTFSCNNYTCNHILQILTHLLSDSKIVKSKGTIFCAINKAPWNAFLRLRYNHLISQHYDIHTTQ